MAFNVRFYSFAKRTNSTKTLYNETSLPLSCVLKDNTDIINPTIVINGGENFNPKFYNYCWISQFNRYYFINTWRYIVGSWECDCECDVLATFKQFIENANKYVLRSSARYNRNIIDTMFPALGWQPDYYTDTKTFNFSRSFDYGVYILGVANNSADGLGAVTYYCTASSTIRRLVEYMMPSLSDWTDTFTGFTDVLYRTIYSPFDYIKSCKWFPISYTPATALETVRFGNYNANEENKEIYMRRIEDTVTSWFSDSRTLNLPTGWMALDAKYRMNPYAHLYLVVNPWGVIELNPLDFANSTQIKCYLYIDFISGDGVLKIYKIVNEREDFITQKIAKISVDVNLSQSSVDIAGILSGAVKTATGVGAMLTTGGVGGLIAGGLEAGNGVTSAAISSTPSLSGSVGNSFDCAVMMEGDITLIYTNTYFAQEDKDERGKPLYETVTLRDLAKDDTINSSGYILCADGDMQIAGAMKQELDKLSEFLTTGFFLE